jgi:hypothetical protein
MHRDALAVEWIHTLYYLGAELVEGESWIEFTVDGKRVLGFIPKNGMLKFSGKCWLAVHVYPHQFDANVGLPTTTVPSTFKPPVQLVLLSPKKMATFVALWPSLRAVNGRRITYRFVPLS